MTGLLNLPSLSDVPGRKIGDIVYAAAAPDSTFVPASGQHIGGQPAFSKKTRLTLPGTGGLAAGVDNNAHISTSLASLGSNMARGNRRFIVDGPAGDLYWITESAGAIYKKARNGLGTGAITLVKAGPTPFNASTTTGLWRAGAYWYRFYQSSSSEYEYEYATDPAGTWTRLSTATFPKAGIPRMYTIFYSAQANRYYANVATATWNQLWYSLDGITGWTLVSGQPGTTNVPGLMFETAGAIYLLSDSTLWKITSANWGAWAIANQSFSTSPIAPTMFWGTQGWMWIPAWGLIVGVYDPAPGGTASWRFCYNSPAGLEAGTAWTSWATPTDLAVGSGLHALGLCIGEDGEFYAYDAVGTGKLYRIVPNRPGGAYWETGVTPDILSDSAFYVQIADFDGHIVKWGGTNSPLVQCANGRERFKLNLTLSAINSHNPYIKIR
jgi:hypothetical protein